MEIKCSDGLPEKQIRSYKPVSEVLKQQNNKYKIYEIKKNKTRNRSERQTCRNTDRETNRKLTRNYSSGR